MEKVLITGANGFVGANLARRLLENHYEVHILTRKTSDLWRLNDLLPQMHRHIVDLLDKEKLNEIVANINPDHIVHLAIFGGLPKQVDVMRTVDVNFIGTINLVEASEQIHYKTFINGGSSSEYGMKTLPMREMDICEPINIYGVTKAAATLYCQSIAKQYNKNIGTIRLFSPFGDYEEKGRLFPELILNAIENKPILLANPLAVRDFIYIEDVIALFLEIISQKKNIRGEIFNCGLGVQHSVGEVTEKILQMTHSSSNVTFGAVAGRLSDSNTWVADMSKTTSYFDWKCEVNFDKSLEKACHWFSVNRHLYK